MNETIEIDADDGDDELAAIADLPGDAADVSALDGKLIRRSDEHMEPLDRYMRETLRHKILTPEEEFAIAQKYQETKDPRLAYRLITSNLRLVVKIAYEFSGYTQNILDLVQEGNIGLMQAVRKFDPFRGVRLTTYARHWIRSYMIYYLLNNHRLVKIGKTQAERKLFFNLRKERARLEAKGIRPDIKLLAATFDVPEKTVVEMSQRLDNSEVSINVPRGDNSRETLGETIPAGTTPEDLVGSSQLQDLLWSKLHAFGDSLDDKREQLLWRDRLLSEHPKTLQDVGDLFGVSRERVRQLEERLKKKLKQYLDDEIGPGKIDLDFLNDS